MGRSEGNQCIYHSTRRLNQPLLQLPGLAEKQGRNWTAHNIQTHFTTRNRRDLLCDRGDDREKRIFPGYRTVWASETIQSNSPARQGRIEQVTTGTRPGGFGMTSHRETPLSVKENTTLTRAPRLKESTAGLEARDTPVASTPRVGERRTSGPEGDLPASAGRGSRSRTWGRAGSAPAAGQGPRLCGQRDAGWLVPHLLGSLLLPRPRHLQRGCEASR